MGLRASVGMPRSRTLTTVHHSTYFLKCKALKISAVTLAERNHVLGVTLPILWSGGSPATSRNAVRIYYIHISIIESQKCFNSFWYAGHSEVEVTLLPMEATFTPGFVLLLAGVGFLSLLIFLLFLLLCQRALKHKQGYQLPSLQVKNNNNNTFLFLI
jgi:hypothetical protein